MNPWGRECWKGAFSVEDSKSWTKTMKEKLAYHLFEETDNGVFWILFEDALKYFDTLELNWNPNMLKYTSTRYGKWSQKDLVEGYSDLSKNP